jgi:hypothetical protein
LATGTNAARAATVAHPTPLFVCKQLKHVLVGDAITHLRMLWSSPPVWSSLQTVMRPKYKTKKTTDERGSVRITPVSQLELGEAEQANCWLFGN